tara:strand:- start:789 stop:1154 length:366 start_codon:yes stop_codon:yes gene_type:complete
MMKPYVYNVILERVVDGDTIDVTLDLGFEVQLKNQRLRLNGIDTPESRTRNLEEKALGKAAAARLEELCEKKFKIESLGRGKYGRILAIPFTIDNQDICKIMIDEGHAVPYFGGKKTKVWA